MPCTIVCCSEIADPKWRWVEANFDRSKINFEFAPCVPRYKFEQNRWLNLARARGCYQAVQLATNKNAQALVTQGPTLAAWCCVFAFIARLKIPILAHAFNFTPLPNKRKRQLFSKALRGVDRFVVFSTMEKMLYARAFDLPLDRFDVVLWGANRPELEGPKSSVQAGAYISAIDGSARDYSTLLSAARELPNIKFVLVARPESLRGFDVPQNLLVCENLPQELAMNVVFHSRFMVLALADFNSPSGQLTLVRAMYLGKACVVADTLGVRDYVRDGETAVTYPVASVDDLVAKIKLLWEDAALCARLGESGQRFASRECGDNNIARHLQTWLIGKGLLS
jgi:glycosyltransferase involved in cell wall biosynthesis